LNREGLGAQEPMPSPATWWPFLTLSRPSAAPRGA